MRRSSPIVVFLFVILLSLSITAVAQEETAEPEVTADVELTAETTAEPVASATPVAGSSYTVQRGDTLFRIAQRFGLSTQQLAAANNITNPRLIFAGQTLIIPGASAPQPDPVVPTSTPIPSTGENYIVQPGDTLFRIAVRFNTTVGELSTLNNLTNPNLIYVGLSLAIPGSAPIEVVEATPTPTPAPSATAFPAPTNLDLMMEPGIEIFFLGLDAAAAASQASQLGVSWVKITLDWRDLELLEGSINFAALDPVIEAFSNAGFSILATVTNTPDWARPDATERALGENGPPSDLNDYVTFITQIAERYQGRINAYQIWHEPNLRRSWVEPSSQAATANTPDTGRLSSTNYIDLLSLSYPAIKAVDPDALVVTAGLAPTGLNDGGRNAIDDRVFLRELLRQGAAQFSDAIGVQPSGFANPPDSRSPEQGPGVATHFDSTRFFFLDTLEEYRAILVEGDAGNLPLWVTRFGWGTSEGNALTQPDANSQYLTYTSPGEQAQYTTRAFAIGAETAYVGPMILYNLNGCQANNGEACYFSLIDSSLSARPAFSALQEALSSAAVPMTEADEPMEAETAEEAALPMEDTGTPMPEATEEAGS